MRSRFDLALAALGAAWIARTSSSLPRWTVDDAFIVSRYADNLVEHGVLAFNADAGAADRVEGFTSPFAMLVAIVVRAFGGDPIAATKLLGFAAALICPILVVLLARALRAPAAAGGFAALAFAFMPEHAVHARSGLETEAFVAATLALLVAFVHVVRSPSSAGRTFAGVAFLAALVRPEGIPVVAIVAAAALFVRRHRPEARRALFRSLLVAVVLPVVALTVFRLAYFHAVLPNTFYAKRAALNDAHARALLGLVDRALVDLAVVAAAALVVARLAWQRQARLGPLRTIVLVTSALALIVQLVGYARAEPVMDYGRRFAWHGAAFLVPFAVVFAERALVALRRFGRAGLVVGASGLALACTDTLTRGAGVFAADKEQIERASRSLVSLQEPTIAWIRENTSRDALVAVYPDAGLVPWTTKRRTIDFGKLNDRVLARADGDDEVVRYFFERAPDVIVLARLSTGRLYDSGAEAIARDPRFHRDYELAHVFPDAPGHRGDTYEIHRRRR